ncbi:MAG TPA: hypothetical protein VFZ58_05205 [Candidatus Saccharimonadales bacterium]
MPFSGNLEFSTPQPPKRAHIEDSVAPAEHLLPDELKKIIDTIGKTATSGKLLQRASFYYEYAIATPDFTADDEYFNHAHQDIDRILADDLPERHPVRFGANVLRAYEATFRARAKQEVITNTLRTELQIKIVNILYDYLGEADLEQIEYGRASELVAIAYLLNGDLFPYFSLHREEGNIVASDNHDLYTLHPCEINQFKKVPISIKFREVEPPSDILVSLPVGRIALTVARSIPPYTEDSDFLKENSETKALRLAADIIICHTNGEPLSVEDNAFLWSMTSHLQTPLINFAQNSIAVDYASRAALLRQEVIIRKEAAARHQALQKEIYQNRARLLQ